MTEKTDKKPFKIRIRWGESLSDGCTRTYKFATQAELNAFIKGIQECEGWQGWEEV